MSIEHRDIPDGGRHEPKGVSSALQGTVYTADGLGSGSWVKPFSLDTSSANEGQVFAYVGASPSWVDNSPPANKYTLDIVDVDGTDYDVIGFIVKDETILSSGNREAYLEFDANSGELTLEDMAANAMYSLFVILNDGSIRQQYLYSDAGGQSPVLNLEDSIPTSLVDFIVVRVA